MFTEMTAELAAGRRPDRRKLRQRFAMAMTKKMGVIRLPPSFWMDDPKINPRSEHMFWAALLLGDREAVDTVVGIMAHELAEKTGRQPPPEIVRDKAHELVCGLLACIAGHTARERLTEELRQVVPDLLPVEGGHV